MRPVPDLYLAFAAVALASAAFIFGITSARAVHTSASDVTALDAEEPGLQNLPVIPELLPAAAEPLTADEIVLVADKAPFQPDRSRPAVRYEVGGEPAAPQAEPPPDAPEEPEPDPPPFTVLGTITASSGSTGIAVIRLGNASPRVVAVGEVIEDFTLEAVEADAVTVAGAGAMFALSLVEASPDPVPARGERQDARARRGQRR